jgi:hypothetical protein
LYMFDGGGEVFSTKESVWMDGETERRRDGETERQRERGLDVFMTASGCGCGGKLKLFRVLGDWLSSSALRDE